MASSLDIHGNQSLTMNVAANPNTSARTGTITVSGSGLTRTISVTQAGAAPQSASISIAPAAPNFGSHAVGYGQRPTQTITVRNVGSASITLNPLPAIVNWTLTPGANWSGAMAPGQSRTFTIRPNNGLAAGTYNPTINITGSGGANAQVHPTFTVTQATTQPSTQTQPQPGAISVAPAAPAFGSHPAGYAQRPTQTVTVRNAGAASVTLNPLPAIANWTLTQGANWNSPMAPGQSRTFTIRPNNGLAAGTYNPTINITGSNGASAQIHPTFTVTAAAPQPQPGAISVAPATPAFGSHPVGYAQRGTQTITVRNAGSTSVTLNPLPAVANWTLVAGANWSGAMAPGQSRTFTIRPNNGLPAGTYNPVVNITGSNGANAQTHPTFTVTAPAGPSRPVTLVPANGQVIPRANLSATGFLEIRGSYGSASVIEVRIRENPPHGQLTIFRSDVPADQVWVQHGAFPGQPNPNQVTKRIPASFFRGNMTYNISIEAIQNDQRAIATTHVIRIQGCPTTDARYFWQDRLAMGWVNPLPNRDILRTSHSAGQFGAARAGGRVHAGIDLGYRSVNGAGLSVHNVYAMDAGQVLFVAPFYAGTDAIVIQHTCGAIIVYGEVRAANGIGRGAHVSRGQRIGSTMSFNYRTNGLNRSMLHMEAYLGRDRHGNTIPLVNHAGLRGPGHGAGGIVGHGNNTNYYFLDNRQFNRRRDLLNPSGVLLLGR